MQAGFAQGDITPPRGTYKIGSMNELRPKKVLDPIFVSVAIFVNGNEKVGLIQFDTLSIRWTQVNDIRNRIEQRYRFPGKSIMLFATHNHAGPAVTTAGKIHRDDEYIETMVQKAVDTFGQALADKESCEIGHGFRKVFNVGYNRRIVMNDGTVRTNATLLDEDAMYIEGPVDPSLSVIGVRRRDGSYLGALVNFASHPVHHGPEPVFSAGYPGVIARQMKKWGVPMTLFLNGACGNISGRNPVTGDCTTKEEAGYILAENAWTIIRQMKFRNNSILKSEQSVLQLSYRQATEEEEKGMVFGAQRIGDSSWYESVIPKLLSRIRDRHLQPAEVQVLFIGDIAIVGIPAEYFSEHGLRIKEKSYPMHTWIVGYANGMVGYLPTAEAIKRGGYETTFAPWSRIAPEAGDQIADEAINLICNNI